MITTRHKATFNRLLDPLARFFLRVGMSPSAVTLSGLLLVLMSCAFLLATRRLLIFCGLVTVGTCFDAIDGAVARASGRVTTFGSYLDAMCDRVGEGAVVLSVALVTGYWLLSGAVLLGALLVSYAKARAAMEIPISNQEWPDVMERTERGVCYIVGLGASQISRWAPLGRDLFWWTLLILSVLIYATVIQRMLRARRLMTTRGPYTEHGTRHHT